MSGQHTLFFSTRCRFCQAFLEELLKTPYKSEIKLFCVDATERGRPALPPWLKSVPTLLLAGRTEADALVGPGPVNNWLFERKMGAGSTPKAPTNAFENRAPLIPPIYKPEIAPRPAATARTAAPSAGAGAVAAAGGDDGPLAYHGTEMGGGKWSDSYSFLEDTEMRSFSSEKGYNRIGLNFESLLPAGGAGGAPVAAAAPKRSPKEEAQQRALDEFMAARDRDVAGPIKRM